MKINILFIALLANISTLFAQSEFDKYQNVEGVSAIIINQQTFSLMSAIGSDVDSEYLEVIKNIESLKTYSTKNKTIAQQMEEEVTIFLQETTLTELIRVKDETNNTIIYANASEKENYVNQLFLFVIDSNAGDEITSIVYITGDIDLKQIAVFAQKMNLPGKDQL